MVSNLPVSQFMFEVSRCNNGKTATQVPAVQVQFHALFCLKLPSFSIEISDNVLHSLLNISNMECVKREGSNMLHRQDFRGFVLSSSTVSI